MKNKIYYAIKNHLTVNFQCGNCSKKNIKDVYINDIVTIDYGYYEGDLPHIVYDDVKYSCDFCKEINIINLS